MADGYEQLERILRAKKHKTNVIAAQSAGMVQSVGRTGRCRKVGTAFSGASGSI